LPAQRENARSFAFSFSASPLPPGDGPIIYLFLHQYFVQWRCVFRPGYKSSPVFRHGLFSLSCLCFCVKSNKNTGSGSGHSCLAILA